MVTEEYSTRREQKSLQGEKRKATERDDLKKISKSRSRCQKRSKTQISILYNVSFSVGYIQISILRFMYMNLIETIQTHSPRTPYSTFAAVTN